MLSKSRYISRRWYRLLLLAGVSSIAALTPACTVQRLPVSILGNFDVAAEDDQVLFAAISPGSSGLYMLRTSTAAVAAVLVRADSGVFSAPCYLARQHRLVYLYRRRGRSTIESCTWQGDSVRVLFATKAPLTSLAVAPTGNQLYFTAAHDMGHSSPVARVSARNIRLYAIVPGDSVAHLASHLRAYHSWGKPQFDASGQQLLLNLFHPEGEDFSGPFALNLSRNELRYLLPHSLFDRKTRLREPGTGAAVRFDWWGQDFMLPVPARLPGSYYLVGSQQIIKATSTTALPQLLYRHVYPAAGADTYSIAGAMPLHRSDSLLVYQVGQQQLRFLLLGPDGRHRVLPVALPLPGR